jgi:molybdopterin synthase catalytic subunit
MRAELVTHVIDAERLIREVADSRRGATAIFLGTVRSTNEGRDVLEIEYSAYDEMAEREMLAVLREAEEKFSGVLLVVEHRVGVLSIGEVSIGIVAAHGHRGPALDALRYAIDQIKARAPIWKRERYADGTEEWVDPSRALAR